MFENNQRHAIMYVNKIDRYNIVMSFVTQCYCLALLILYKYKRFYIVLHV